MYINSLAKIQKKIKKVAIGVLNLCFFMRFSTPIATF